MGDISLYSYLPEEEFATPFKKALFRPSPDLSSSSHTVTIPPVFTAGVGKGLRNTIIYSISLHSSLIVFGPRKYGYGRV